MSKLALIALSLLAVPGMASAGERPGAQPTAAAKQKEKLYCIAYEEVTGSRVASKECRTKAQWARRGVTIDANGQMKS